MPVEDITKNHELLAKVLSHYRYRLEHLQEESKTSMSNAMKENLAFKDTIKQIEQVLALKGVKAKEDAKKHVGLLTLAVTQYAKDLEAAFEKAKNLLPDTADGDLHRLETELKTVKSHLGQ